MNFNNRNQNIFILVGVYLVLCLMSLSASAAPSDQTSTSNQATNPNPVALQPARLTPPPPSLNAKAYILIDAASGNIIAQKNANTKLAPASLTKLMSLYIVQNALASKQLSLKDKIKISTKAWRTGGSRMFVKVNTEVPVEKLIKGIIVASGNDATVALSEYLGGTESGFANMMNQSAQQLGMSNSHFTNATGLPNPKHYSTAADMSKLARAIILNHKQYYSWFKQKWIKYNGIRQPNRNRLLWRDPSVDGLKTGHTDAAGYCLISSAKRKNTRLISVVMGTPSENARANESEALLNYGFHFYTTKELFKRNTPIKKVRVWKGNKAEVELGLKETLYVTVPKGQYSNIKLTAKVNKTLTAPINKNQAYGKLLVQLHGKTIASKPLVALNDDEVGSFFTRMKDSIESMFKGWFS